VEDATDLANQTQATLADDAMGITVAEEPAAERSDGE
jgi:hypothetical protein